MTDKPKQYSDPDLGSDPEYQFYQEGVDADVSDRFIAGVLAAAGVAALGIGGAVWWVLS